MPLKQIIKRITNDRRIDEVQEDLIALNNDLVGLPLLDGLLIENVSLSTSEIGVAHTLGRPIRGWIIVDKDSDVRVWRSSKTNPSVLLNLTASGTTTVSLWVF